MVHCYYYIMVMTRFQNQIHVEYEINQEIGTAFSIFKEDRFLRVSKQLAIQCAKTYKHYGSVAVIEEDAYGNAFPVYVINCKNK